jgi:Uncharacterized protein conserved in bacteria
MRKFLLVITCVLTSWTISAQNENSIVGYWLTQDKDSKIEIYKGKDGLFYGSIRWLKEPNRNGVPKKDDKNPNTTLKNRALLGLSLLNGFHYNSEDKEWVDGTIYDPKSGKTYKCLMWFDGNFTTLHVKGYIGFSLIGKEVNWTKINQ